VRNVFDGLLGSRKKARNMRLLTMIFGKKKETLSHGLVDLIFWKKRGESMM
jgi:hypothetical protein